MLRSGIRGLYLLREAKVTDETKRFRAGAALSERYRLMEKLGEGGTGMVFRASRVEMPDHNVAVKLLLGPARACPPAWTSDPSLLTALDPPRLVKVHACGELAGVPYLEMEYVEGATLRRGMRPGQPWPLARAAGVVLGLADALSYLHQRG